MHQDLKQRLLTWKNELHPGEIKKVFISDSPLKDGMLLIRLEKSLSGKLSDKISQVSVSNKFITSEHPSSDMDHLDKVIKSLEEQFNDRYEQVMNEAFQDKLVHLAQFN